MAPVASRDMIDLTHNSRRTLFHLMEALIESLNDNMITVGYVEEKHGRNKEVYALSCHSKMLDFMYWLDDGNRRQLWHMIRGLPPGRIKDELTDAASQLHMPWTK